MLLPIMRNRLVSSCSLSLNKYPKSTNITNFEFWSILACHDTHLVGVGEWHRMSVLDTFDGSNLQNWYTLRYRSVKGDI